MSPPKEGHRMLLSGPKQGSQQRLVLGWKLLMVEMASWKPLAQDPVLPIDEMLICSVVQKGGSKRGLFPTVDAYKSQPHARDRIK